MLSLNDKTGTLVGNIYACDIIPTKISRMSLQRDTPKVTVEKKMDFGKKIKLKDPTEIQ